MKFQRPSIYPFWLWNGEQNEEELTRQLRLAEQRGLPGLTIHARTGNQIPYLSKRWMELFRHACIEAKKLGLYIWIYDELGFPSGTANGALPAKGESYQQKYLEFSLCSKEKIPLNPLAVFPREDGRYLVFQRKVQPAFPDFLYAGTANAFLELVHEKYYAALKDFFGNTIQAVFTDDNVLLLQRGATLPYTDDLEDTFTKTFGVSLLKNLDALVENRPGYEKIRLSYYRHLAERLNEGFIRPVQQWCTDHGLKFYGHLSSDEGPLDYCARSFGDPGQYMMTLHVPGCDDFLTMFHDHSYMRNPRNHFKSIDFLNGARGFSAIEVMKQASSVASQLGDGICMSETFSSLGWGVSPAALIAHMNFLCQMGITISVPHYYTYSTALQAKRDHPASFFFQQPYFTHSKEIFAETDRTLQLTGRGRNIADVLVIHPITAAQASLDGEAMDIPGNFQCEYPRTLPSPAELTDSFQEISLQLMRAHIAFEYGYESVLEKHGSVRNGCFCIGKAEYRTVILPKICVISDALRQLLLKAAGNGVRIVYLAARPIVLNGTPAAPELSDLPGEYYDSWDTFSSHLPAPLLENITSAETAVSGRMTEEHPEYMLVHYGEHAVKQHFALSGYRLYDPAENRAYPLPMDFLLRPGHAVHLLPESMLPQTAQVQSASSETVPVKEISWNITRMNPNFMLIDAMRMPYGFMTRFDCEDFLYEPEGVITFRKMTLQIPNGKPVFLCYEPLAVSMLKVNGKDVLTQLAEPCEPTASVVKTDITAILNESAGQMTLTMQTRVRRPEFLYLQGDFGVALDGSFTQQDGGGSEIPPEPCMTVEPTLTFGNLTKQGLPFYWGTIRYAASVSLSSNGLLNIVLPEVNASAIELRINGQSCGTRNDVPWAWSVPVNAGKTEIELLLMNTAQNFFGPHHPDTQKKHFSAWRPADESYFSLAPFGILQNPVVTLSPGK